MYDNVSAKMIHHSVLLAIKDVTKSIVFVKLKFESAGSLWYFSSRIFEI